MLSSSFWLDIFAVRLTITVSPICHQYLFHNPITHLGWLRSVVVAYITKFLCTSYPTLFSQLPHTPPCLQVNQHFSGRFEDCPDSDFAAVIQRVDAVWLDMSPVSSPAAPTRIWCLFEIATAQLKGITLHLFAVDSKASSSMAAESSDHETSDAAIGKLDDGGVWNPGGGSSCGTTIDNTAAPEPSSETSAPTEDILTLPSIDVGGAHASMDSDRELILSLVTKAFGSLEACNCQITALLRASILDHRLVAHSISEMFGWC